MDLSGYHTLNNFAFHHALVGAVARFFASDAIFVTVGALVLLCLIAGRHAFVRDRRGVLAAGVSAALAIALAAIIGDLWDRTRPFVHHVHHLLVAHAADASFPSDHVSALSAIAVALLLRRRVAGVVVLIVTALVAVARVMVGVHYPTDVIGGFGDGLLMALVVFAVMPVRAGIDRTADAVGRRYDRLVGAVEARLVPGRAGGDGGGEAAPDQAAASGLRRPVS